MIFHELSWTWNHETLQLRVDCAAMDYRRNAIEFCKIMKFQLFEFLQLVVVKVSFVTDSFFWQRACPELESFASRKLDRENWKADFKVDALHENKVATQSSVVKPWYLDCTIVLQCVAAQGRVGRGITVVTALRIAKNIAWCSIQQKNSGGDVAKEWGHGLMFRSRQR